MHINELDEFRMQAHVCAVIRLVTMLYYQMVYYSYVVMSHTNLPCKHFLMNSGIDSLLHVERKKSHFSTIIKMLVTPMPIKGEYVL